MKSKYYPCVWYANKLHTLKSDGRYHNLSSMLRDVCYATSKRAWQEVNKQPRILALHKDTYKGLVLSSDDFEYLNNTVFNNDEIYFETEKEKAVLEYIKNKFAQQ